ncbi:MAG: redoxin domain-containing protein [Myxococcales bacterium]|nr:redoxin domain-containing protein [Myxococcales bacterium]
MRRWEELRPELDARGVALVAICPDAPDAIRAGRGKHGLRGAMLSDADLALTKAFGILNRRSATPSGFVPITIPTTFLVDARGVVRWIDQAEDYMVRSAPERVLEALRAHLDG